MRRVELGIGPRVIVTQVGAPALLARQCTGSDQPGQRIGILEQELETVPRAAQSSVLPQRSAGRLRDLADALLRGPDTRLWNLYGPTETTVWSAAAPVPPASGHGRPDR